MADQPTFTIPKDVIEPVIQAHVATAVAAALGGQGRLVEEAVKMALERKVDRDGKVDGYSSSSSPTFLQWLVNDAIRKAAEAAVREQITGEVEAIKAMVAKEIKNQRSPLTRALIQGIANAATDAKKLSISVEVKGVVADSGRY